MLTQGGNPFLFPSLPLPCPLHRASRHTHSAPAPRWALGGKGSLCMCRTCRKDAHGAVSSFEEMPGLGVICQGSRPSSAARRRVCGRLEEKGGHSARGVLGGNGFYLASLTCKSSQLTKWPLLPSLRPFPFPESYPQHPYFPTWLQEATSGNGAYEFSHPMRKSRDISAPDLKYKSFRELI